MQMIKCLPEQARLCRYLVNNSKRIPIIGEQSANKIAQLPAIKGNIGKTGVLELLRGEKQSVKGWQVIEDRAPDRANKSGVEKVGNKGVRQRLPMQIYIHPSNQRGMTGNESGDFALFLASVFKQAHDNGGKVEYDALRANAFPTWTREMVSVYASRAQRLGYVTTERVSSKLAKKGV